MAKRGNRKAVSCFFNVAQPIMCFPRFILWNVHTLTGCTLHCIAILDKSAKEVDRESKLASWSLKYRQTSCMLAIYLKYTKYRIHPSNHPSINTTQKDPMTIFAKTISSAWPRYSRKVYIESIILNYRRPKCPFDNIYPIVFKYKLARVMEIPQKCWMMQKKQQRLWVIVS